MPPPKQFDCYSTGLITEAELKEIRASMVPSLFAANYELRHIAAEDLIFTDPQTGVDPAKAEQADACHVDAAYGGGDGTAFTVCRKYGGKYYVFGKLWQRHVFGCLPEIVDLRKAFKAGIIYCKANGDHGYLARDLRELGERVITYHEDTNKFLKIASHLKGAWKDVVFVEGTDPEYIRQICDYNENAEHDDAPDSLASLIRILHPKKDAVRSLHTYQDLLAIDPGTRNGAWTLCSRSFDSTRNPTCTRPPNSRTNTTVRKTVPFCAIRSSCGMTWAN